MISHGMKESYFEESDWPFRHGLALADTSIVFSSIQLIFIVTRRFVIFQTLLSDAARSQIDDVTIGDDR